MAVEASGADEHQGRWFQLIIGIVCMVMIANLQYGWNLFVDPMSHQQHWSRAAIGGAFSLFVLAETWLVPVESWFVDRFGPRIVVMVGGILVALGWALDSIAAIASDALRRGDHLRHWRRRGLRHLCRQCAEMVCRTARPGCRPDRGGFRRRRCRDGGADPICHRRAWLSVGLSVVRAWSRAA